MRLLLFALALLIGTPSAQAGGLSGLADLHDYRKNCHGVLIQPRASTPDTAPAYVLTAGHCVSVTDGANRVYWDPAVPRSLSVDLDGAVRAQERAIRPARVLYARSPTAYSDPDLHARSTRDLTILELPYTLGQLRARGIEPWTLSLDVLAAGQSGVAFDPAWRAVAVKVGDYMGRVFSARRDPRQPGRAVIDHGSSGGPLLDLERRQLLGIASGTTSTDADQEVVFTQVGDLLPCFDSEGRFDAHRVGCRIGN